jgi:hypothetical protein
MLLECDSAGSIDVASGLAVWQFYNHFPDIWLIARTVEFARNHERMMLVLPSLYTFHSKSFLLPGQFASLMSDLLSIPKKSNRTFIVKPDRALKAVGCS